jgi:carboxypeptidase PM20D1
MNTGAIAAIAVAAAVLVLIAAMIIRAAANKPAPLEKSTVPPAQIDKDKAVEHLRQAVRIKTVSMVEDYIDNIQPFIDYRDWLEKTYPLLHKCAERTIIEGYSLIFHIKGEDSTLKGGCFLSHIDVVPAPPEGWEHEPFSGDLSEDGYIYGRGAQDMKSHMIALLEAVEYKLSKGERFKRDLYLCFGHDEEPGPSMSGAYNIVKHLKEKGVEMEFVIDEGGTVLDGSMLGIPHQVALIGASEKGNGDLEVVVKKTGGHASNPKPPTAVGILCECVDKIEKHPMRPHWSPLAKEMFRSLAPHSKGVVKFVLTNRDVLSPVVKAVLTVAAPMTNALVRTTFSPTMLWGADARNVLPSEARANINYRMISGETAQDVKAYLEKLLKKRIKRGEVEIRLLQYTDPSPEADVRCRAYANLKKSIEEAFDDTIVAPYPFIAASDARFYNPLTDNVFRFGPFVSSLDDQKRIHGINERLHVDQLERAVRFFAVCLDNMMN